MTNRRKRRPGSDRHHAGSPLEVGGPLHLAAGLGDAERERIVLSGLQVLDDVEVVERCLSADQLLACLQKERVDVMVVGFDLHRLTEARLEELMHSRVPLVLLAPDHIDERWRNFAGALLPLDANAKAVSQAIQAVVRGDHPRPSEPGRGVQEQAEVEVKTVEVREPEFATLTVAGGYGSPGRTTIALNLATALGAAAPTVLVDADLTTSSLAAYLDADPTRNLSMLVYAEPETPRDWDRAIAQEVQPLHPRSPHGVVLCGVPKPEMRSTIPVSFFAQLVGELQQRYHYVILDTGADLLGPEASLHRTALALAQQVLMVAAADVVGLWHSRVALGLLQTHLDLPPERIALVINRHDRRHHNRRSEIEWALGVPVAVVIPYDHHGMQRALADQHPLVLDGHSQAGHALLDLAQRVHRGQILLPPEAKEPQKRWWRIPMRVPAVGRKRKRSADFTGVGDGDYVTPVS